jgi:tetrapyrrole methylase family protein/MazG family protein
VGVIRVVGLGGRLPSDDWQALLCSRPTFVRSATQAAMHTPPGCTYTKAFDAAFESRDPAPALDFVVSTMLEQAVAGDIAYLVPGSGQLGDSTVAALAAVSRIEVLPGQLLRDRSAVGSACIVDALDLAVRDGEAPFEAGVSGLDPTRGVIVTNLTGGRVTERALWQLSRQFPGESLLPDAEGTLYLRPRDPLTAPGSFDALAHIVARLRRPDGCPWDREQTSVSLLPDLAEEVGELEAAIASGDWENVAEELGDVLLHVLMQAQVAHEAGLFAIEDVLSGINAKLVRRHPHVFGDETAATPTDVLSVWQNVKRQEKLTRQQAEA